MGLAEEIEAALTRHEGKTTDFDPLVSMPAWRQIVAALKLANEAVNFAAFLHGEYPSVLANHDEDHNVDRFAMALEDYEAARLEGGAR